MTTSTISTAVNKIKVPADVAPLVEEYLTERGFTWAHFGGSKWKALDPADTMALAGTGMAWGRGAIEYPYIGFDGRPDGFSALRFLGEAIGFEPTEEQERPPKSWQARGSATPAYLSPLWRGPSWLTVAHDTSIPIYLTESVAKATAGCIHGFPTIGFTSVHTWHVKGHDEVFVKYLDEFDFNGRIVGVVFDSDAATKPQVLQAEEKLRAALASRGARVMIVRLPPTKDGKKQGLDDYLAHESADAFRKIIAASSQFPEPQEDGRAIFEREFPPRAFAIYPYFVRGTLTELHGPIGSYKSMLMLDAVLCVATGTPWGNCPVDAVRPGKAVFISLEDDLQEIQSRALAWLQGPPKHVEGQHRTAEQRKALQKAIIENGRFYGAGEAERLVLTYTDHNKTFVDRGVLEHYVRLCQGAQLAVIETAALIHPGGEDNQSLSVLANAVAEIARRSGACVVVIRHMTKDGERSGQIDALGGRGGGSFAGRARSVLVLAREGRGENALKGRDDDPVVIHHVKHNWTPAGASLAWRPHFQSGGVWLKPLTIEQRKNLASVRLLDTIRAAGKDGVYVSKLCHSKTTEEVAQVRGALAALVEENAIVLVRKRLSGTKRGPVPEVALAVEHATPDTSSAAPEAPNDAPKASGAAPCMSPAASKSGKAKRAAAARRRGA